MEDSIDTLWVSNATYLVFLMQLGFALLEVGSVRQKNAQNILLKNFMDICISTLTWWLLGYGLAFGGSSGGFVGYKNFAGTDFENTDHYRNWMFQWAFAGTTATIVSGSLAERTRMTAYIIFAIFITSIIYPLVVNWTWGGGWLTELGYVDFAGSSIVHMVGGIAGLIGAKFVGPRKNRFHTNHKNNFQPHNIPFVVFGAFILWFGWYGFNCGSTLAITGDNKFLVSKIGMVTTISAASGGLTSFLVDARNSRKMKKNVVHVVPALTNGILAGLVGITAGCASVEPYAGFIIGSLSGILCFYVSEWVKKAKIDDPLDAFAVHGFCGMFGTLMVGFFDTNGGLFYSGMGWLLGYQIAGILSIGLWTVFFSSIAFGLMKKMNMLRVSEKEEEEGLDKFEMGSSAYEIT